MASRRLQDTGTDTDRTSRRGFVFGQVRGLRPFEFVTFIAPSADGFAYVEVSRDEQGNVSTIEIGEVPAFGESVRVELAALGFVPGEKRSVMRWTGSGADQVASLVTSVLDGPLGVAADAPLDVHHGSRRAEVELQRKLAHIRDRVRAVVDALVGPDAVKTDTDSDLVFDFETTRVFVGTRVLASTEIIVRVFAIVSVDVDASPALGLFLAEANFALAIGKFSLDPVRRVVWFEEALLGEAFTDAELRRVIELIAVTTNDYDDRIAQMFGGRTATEAACDGNDVHEVREKTGRSGYL